MHAVMEKPEQLCDLAAAEEIDLRPYCKETACVALLFWCCARAQEEKRQASIKLVEKAAAADEDFGEASCRIEQTLLQAGNLPMTKAVKQRLARYAKELAAPALKPWRERL